MPQLDSKNLIYRLFMRGGPLKLPQEQRKREKKESLRFGFITKDAKIMVISKRYYCVFNITNRTFLKNATTGHFYSSLTH